MSTYQSPSEILPTPDDRPPFSALMLRLGAILWPSFFAAGVATMVFFAVVDPAELALITWPHADISRELGYTIGFFMFWACTASACAFTALLLKPPPMVKRSSRRSSSL